jgi:peptidoglycan/xylan/chitin deacetylase (PgdA/CDA1 family)
MGGLQRSARRGLLDGVLTFALQRTTPATAILCYHGIRPLAGPTAGTLHVSLSELVTAVEDLREIWTIVPLSEIIQRERRGRGNQGLLAITFDDACVTVLHEAAEFLGREQIPVTIFPVATAAREGARFWWDRLDELFLRVSPAEWRRFEDACGLPDAYRRGQPLSLGFLRPMRQWILGAFRGRWPSALEAPLQRAEQAAGSVTPQRSMTFEEIQQAARLAPIEVGVHTLTHPVLPLLPDEELCHEIAGGYEAVAAQCPNPIPVLAVPFGLFDARTILLAQRAGMVSSLSLGGTGLNRVGSGACLPRVCMSTGSPRWKLMLRLSGFVDRWLVRDLGTSGYPELPSATT